MVQFGDVVLWIRWKYSLVRLRQVVAGAVVLQLDEVDHVAHEATFQGQAYAGENNDDRSVSTWKLKVVVHTVNAYGRCNAPLTRALLVEDNCNWTNFDTVASRFVLAPTTHPKTRRSSAYEVRSKRSGNNNERPAFDTKQG